MFGELWRSDWRARRASGSGEDAWSGRPIVGAVLHAIRLVLWSIVHFAFYFVQQVAELVAPLLLAVGIGWWALPRIVDAITTHAATADQQARDILNTISGTIPHGLMLAGHWVTPATLIVYGLLLMAVAALGATLSALAARAM